VLHIKLRAAVTSFHDASKPNCLCRSELMGKLVRCTSCLCCECVLHGNSIGPLQIDLLVTAALPHKLIGRTQDCLLTKKAAAAAAAAAHHNISQESVRDL
jgi:hypothetical protein